MEAFDSARGSQSQCGWFAGIPPASRWIKNCSRSLARGADWWRASAAGREKYVLNKELPPMNPRFVELRCSGNAKASPAETSLAARSVLTERTHEFGEIGPNPLGFRNPLRGRPVSR
jgi:hypothetical protein